MNRALVIACAGLALVAVPLLAPSPGFRGRQLHPDSEAWARRYRISEGMADLIIGAADRHGVSRAIAFRLVRTESSFDPRALSHKGAVGLAQVMPETAQEMRPGITIEQLYRPHVNVDLGFRYLRRQLRRYYGDYELALAAYLLGPQVADTLMQPDTLAYVNKVLGRAPAAAAQVALAVD